MRLANIVLALIAVLWVGSVLSIRFIPERCVVCGKQEGSNDAEKLRTLSLVEWAYDGIPDLHYRCSHKWDGKIHSPLRSK